MLFVWGIVNAKSVDYASLGLPSKNRGALKGRSIVHFSGVLKMELGRPFRGDSI